MRIYEKTSTETTGGLLFIIRVNREVKRVYINGCRYNERLNSETEGSKTSYIHCQSTWVVRILVVGRVLLMTWADRLNGGTGTPDPKTLVVVYYKSRKRDLEIRLMNESRCKLDIVVYCKLSVLYTENCLLWINKAKTKDKMYMSVGVMKDYKPELIKLLDSHTLGWPWNWNT